MRKRTPSELAQYIQDRPELSDRNVARHTLYSVKTVRRYRRRLLERDELPAPIDSQAREVLLDRRKLPRVNRPAPDFNLLLQPTHPPGTTLRSLWERYAYHSEDALSYSQFTRRLAEYLRERRVFQVGRGVRGPVAGDSEAPPLNDHDGPTRSRARKP